MEDVHFAYPGRERPALRGIDLQVPARASAAFVGPTGSGKTTLVDVVLGLLTPDRGRVAVDGVAIEGATIARWQASLGYVPQSIVLLNDTVTRNIALGVPDELIDEAAVRRAAEIAQIDRVVDEELDRGYDTVVGERGGRLSGGQRQRLGLARALYGDPDVLVLDEATSALDAETELAVRDAVARLAGRTTLITVAHRIVTVRACDPIFVVDQGRVVAQGSYDHLLRHSALFRRLAVEDAGDSGARRRPPR